MKFSTITVLLAVVACASFAQTAPANLEAHKAAFEDFKLAHGKQYSNIEEEVRRFEIFSQNLKEIERFNEQDAPEAGYTRAVNSFADMESAELKKIFGLMPLNKEATLKYVDNEFLNQYIKTGKSAPAEFDWRKVAGTVAPVKNQGQCGSCWAFATTGLLEGQEKKSGLLKKLNRLSEQDLVDCSEKNSGCGGGIMHAALEDIQMLGGIEKEADYPYKGYEGKCRFHKEKAIFTDKGPVVAHNITESDLKLAVHNYGPVAIAIFANFDGFMSYSSGVMSDKRCSNLAEEMDHAVLIVGYGVDKKLGDYWIVKNSWGEKWGESGYIRIARNKNNMCGVLNMPTFAKV